jgi:hypothetical protein
LNTEEIYKNYFINFKNEKIMKTGLIIIGSLIVFGLICFMWAVGVSNSEIKVRNTGEAQKKVCEAYFDKMWKIINQDAQVADKYKEAFKEIYVPLIAGRYSKGDGTLMKWITEHNPQFDAKLYDKLMNAIEGQRDGFFIEQEKLVDIDRQHKNLRQTFPNKLIIGDRPSLVFKIITSTKTEETYKTGKEDDIKL